MERAVEVAVLDRGKLETIHVLSPRRERLATWAAGLSGAGLVAAGMSVAVAWLGIDGQVVHAPTFFGCWAAAGAFVGGACARFARRRVSRYRIGTDIEADAFAPDDLDLVRRAGGVYELGLVRGMSGVLEGGRAPMPIEAITGRGSTWVPLPAEGLVRVEMDGATFVIGRPPEENVGLAALARRVLPLARQRLGRLARVATLGVAAGGIASAALSVPAMIPLSAFDMRGLPFVADAVVSVHLEMPTLPVAEGLGTGQHPLMDPDLRELPTSTSTSMPARTDETPPPTETTP